MPDGSLAYVAPDFGANGVRPTIEMAEGETLDITLKNELSSDVSLHVHGVHYKQDSDGTRHSNSLVKPGQQRVYQWKAGAGTSGYWHYHDHVMGDDEGSTGILSGLYGGLIVRMPGDPKPSKTFVIVGHDKTLNGRIYPDTPTYTAREGELVEWLVISHGNRVHTFHLHAHRWITPNRPTGSSPANAANAGSGHEDNHILAPGDSFGFMVIAGEGVGPGMWMYHCHFQDHASAMKGFFKVLPAGGSTQVETSRTFQETGKTVSGRFLEYWTQNGGLAQQGFPLSNEFQEKSDLDGKTYKVQYFERSVFEFHPENKPPYDVLLSQLGTFRYKEKYPAGR
jgi:FtsP/CotA-like multicopper oxidase with cupredoxin domain